MVGARYTIPLRITVDVESAENVVAAAKAETQRKFNSSDEEWEAHDRPFIAKHFGHALGILLTSDAVSGSLTGILERTVPGLSVTGVHVATSEVENDSEDDR